MNYIFVTGAPGSRWSSVVANIYHSNSIDQSDSNPSREYHTPNTGKVMHMGAYWGPGMEFGAWFQDLASHSVQDNQQEFDRPFSGQGKRIIKSHHFAYNIDYLRTMWPQTPVVLVLRDSERCFAWWHEVGGFDIQYPNYQAYGNLDKIKMSIAEENALIQQAIKRYPVYQVFNNRDLARILQIEPAPQQYQQNYIQSDLEVYVLNTV